MSNPPLPALTDARAAALRRFRGMLARAASIHDLATAALECSKVAAASGAIESRVVESRAAESRATESRATESRAAVLLADGGGSAHVAAARGLSETARELIARHAPRQLLAPWSATRWSEAGAAAVWLSDIERDSEWAPAHAALSSEGIRTVAFVPASYGERSTVALAWCLGESESLPEAELPLFETIAAELALAVEHRRALAGSKPSAVETPLSSSRASSRERERTQLLAAVSNALASSLDPSTTLQKLATFVVPALADYAVTYGCEGALIRRLGFAHRNPARVPLLETLLASGDPSRDDRHGPGAVIRTGAPILARHVTEETILRSSQNDRHQRAILALAPRSSMVVPLESRGRIVGAISFAATDESGRCYDEDDLRFVTDLAQQVALLVDNARLYREACEAIRMRDDILAVVSHDLRSPLNTISVAANLLELGPSPEVARKAQRSIGRAAKQMERLVADLLDISRAESGSLPLALAPVDVAALIDEAYALALPQAEDKSVSLERRVSTELGEVEGDRDRLLQVLNNLLGNAIKFVPAGGAVSIGAQDLYGQIRVWISDNGPGIAADHVPRVFERFWQANRQGGRGAGLGLTIAKGIIDAHGGQIGVHSQEGEGCTFFCWLPCSAARTLRSPSEAPARAEAARESVVPPTPVPGQ